MLNIIIVFKNISNCQFLLPVQHTFIEDKVIQVGIATIECFDGLTFFKSCAMTRDVLLMSNCCGMLPSHSSLQHSHTGFIVGFDTCPFFR